MRIMQEACASMEQVDDGFAHHEPIILTPKSLAHGEDIESFAYFFCVYACFLLPKNSNSQIVNM